MHEPPIVTPPSLSADAEARERQARDAHDDSVFLQPASLNWFGFPMGLLVLGPAMLYQFWLGGRAAVYTGLAIAIFLIVIGVEARRAARRTQTMARLRSRICELAAQRQQALDLAERCNAVKDRFLATMSHEMRTPLHGILGLANLLQGMPHAGPHGPAVEATTESLRTLQRTGVHLLNIINDVLDFSKVTSGQMRLSVETFDLAALLNAVTDAAKAPASAKQISFELSSPLQAPCWVRGDPTRLRQILLNLTGNAVKFTADGGVTLTVQRHNDGTTDFDVLDTGIGIPPHQREDIFMAFHQLDSSDGRRHGGTGLGLTISRELARAMSGDVVCTPRSEPGAAFCLSVPLPPADPPEWLTPEPTTPQPHLAGHVLLAEDNPVNAIVARAILEHIGVQVTEVSDGAQAVTAAAQGSYDLILMDCQMPGVDGFEATQQIRKHEAAEARPRVPIVALTANTLDVDRQRSFEVGMDAHLAKPFGKADMIALLSRFLTPRPL